MGVAIIATIERDAVTPHIWRIASRQKPRGASGSSRFAPLLEMPGEVHRAPLPLPCLRMAAG